MVQSAAKQQEMELAPDLTKKIRYGNRITWLEIDIHGKFRRRVHILPLQLR